MAQNLSGYKLLPQHNGPVPPRSCLKVKSYLIKSVLTVFVGLVIAWVIYVNLGHKSTRTSLVSSQRRPLTVLLSTSDADISEIDYWIHRIVSNLERPVDIQVMELENLQVVDDSIVLCLNRIKVWTDAIVKSGFRNVGLLRIGDEEGKDGSYQPFAYALRPYWFQKIYATQTNDTPVLWIPNGYSHGVGPRLSSTLLPYSMRPQLCYFEGSLRDNGQPSSREKMRAALSEWDPKREICDVRWTNGFMDGHHPLIYSATLGRAKYALCPAGNNAETIRFYEALENNAIPIVVREPWLAGVFGEDARFPFIVLDSWDEIGPRIDALKVEDPAIGQARQMATRKWWDEIQEKIASDGARLVDNSFYRKYGEDIHA